MKVPCIAKDGDYGSSAPASFKLKTGDAGGAAGAGELIKFINGLSGSWVSRDKPSKMGDKSKHWSNGLNTGERSMEGAKGSLGRLNLGNCPHTHLPPTPILDQPLQPPPLRMN